VSAFSKLIKWLDATAEEKFLLKCCSGASQPALAMESPPALSKTLDWRSIRKRLREYPFAGDSGLLWPEMARATRSASIPPDVLDYVYSIYNETSEENKVLLQELADVTTTLERCRIPSLVSKGPALILLSYYNPGVRRSFSICSFRPTG
jgi:hypothetical protein